MDARKNVGAGSTGRPRKTSDWRLPPRRPYLSTGEIIALLILSMLGAAMFVLPLQAQYSSLLAAFHLVPNVGQDPKSIPRTLLNGLFAPRFTLLGQALPAGLITLAGLLILCYVLFQSSWRLTVHNPRAEDWAMPIAFVLPIIGLALWLATFSQILPHYAVPWSFIFAVNGPILLNLVFGGYSRRLIPISICLLPLEFFILHNYFETSILATILVILLSLPLTVLWIFVLTGIWLIKTLITGEHYDYYLTEKELNES